MLVINGNESNIEVIDGQLLVLVVSETGNKANLKIGDSISNISTDNGAMEIKGND